MGATIVWTILVSTAFYICLFKGVELSWWLEYAKYHTYALGFIVGTLTITDSVLKV